MTIPGHGLHVGDLILGVRSDTTGLEADLTGKLTAVERNAVASTGRISSAVGKSGTEQVATQRRVLAAQERVVAATERYNTLLREESVSVGKLASAHASQISAQDRLARVQAETAVGAERTVVATKGLGVGGVAGIVGATFAAEALFHSFEHGAQAAGALQRAQAQTEVAIKATGGAAGVSAEHVNSLAEEAAKLGIATDTDTTKAQNLLLSYQGIQGVRFDRTLKDAEDLAVAFSNSRGEAIDLAAAAKALGSAEQDPAAGVTRLARLGVQFDAQTKQRIKNIANAGDQARAQELLLNAVEAKVAGSSEAFSKSAEGSAARAKISYEEFSRSLAITVLPVATKVFDDLAGAMRFLEEHRGLRTVAVDVAAAAAGYVLLNKALTFAKDLRQSEIASLAARRFGFASNERVVLQAIAAEDRHAEAVSGAATAINTETAAVQRNTIALAENATAATATATRQGAFAESMALQQTVIAGQAARSNRLRRGIQAGGAVAGIGGIIAGQQVGGTTGSILQSTGTGALLGSAIGPEGTVIGGIAGAGFGLARNFGAKSTVNVGGKELTPDQFAELSAGKLAKFPTQVLETFDKIFDKNIVDEIARFHLNSKINEANRLAAAPQERAFAARQRLAGRADALEKKARAAAQGVDDTGLFAALPQAPKVDTAGLNDRVANATDRLATAQDRLNALRSSGKASADQLATAERSVASAQRSSDAASRALAEGQKKANEKTALSADAVLKRAHANAHSVREQLKAEQELVDHGLSGRALKSLQALEQQAPGTAQRLAKNLTDAEIKQLNRDASRRQNALQDLARLPDDAAAQRVRNREYRLAGQQAADAFGEGWRDAFGNGLPLFQSGFNRANPAGRRRRTAGQKWRASRLTGRTRITTS